MRVLMLLLIFILIVVSGCSEDIDFSLNESEELDWSVGGESKIIEETDNDTVILGDSVGNVFNSW